MQSLASAELYKLRHTKLLWIILGLIALQTYIQMDGLRSLEETPVPGQLAITKICDASPFLCIWLAAFTGFFIAAEFQTGVLRNTLALGKKRSAVYCAKLIAAFLACTAMLSVTALTATAVCSALFGFGGMGTGEFLRFFLWTFFNQTVYHLGYAALFTFFAFVSRNAAMTVLLGVGWTVIEQMILGFLGNYQGGSLAFARQIFPGLYIAIFYSVEYDTYWYNNATQIIKGIAAGVLFAGASSGAGIMLFGKQDVK
jgi:ABC-2 type transport system permease protein